MALPVAKKQKLEADESITPQLLGARYDNTTAHGNSRNVYGNVINTYNVGPQQTPAGLESTPDAPGQIVNDIKNIMNNLEFEQMDDRLATIATAHSKTCEWLFHRKEYQAWRDPGALTTNRGFLWLKGKPGAGKSTLMKKARHHGEQEHGDLIISFFFNARGVEFQKSTEGMYRSLLYQLMDNRVEQLTALSGHEGCSRIFQLLENLVENLPRRRNRLSSRVWPIELLKDMLRDLVLAFSPAQVAHFADASNAHADTETAETYRNPVLALAQMQVTCYVDALDECKNDDARDMVDFLGTLRATAAQADVGFRVLLTSRHYPHITFNACQELIFDGQEGHEADIAEYISSRLRIGEGKLAQEVKATIQARASGVFLWVVLVIRMLNELYDRGQIRRMRQRLDAIPGGLHELFEEILHGDTQEGEERLLVFQWLIFSQRPLSLEEFYHAVTGAFESGDVGSRDQNGVSEDDMKRFLLDASKGLAEMTESLDPTVQFIHESVKDYLLDTGLLALKPSLGSDIVGQCHARLLDCCRHYLELAEIALSPILADADALPVPAPEETLPTVHELMRKAMAACPFLEISVECILYHAEFAHLTKSQEEIAKFIAAFPQRLWRRLYNLHPSRKQLSVEVSPLYILVLKGTHKLAEAHINTQGTLQQPPKQSLTEYHRSLLGAAVANRDHIMVTMLLGRGIGANWPAEADHTCLSLAVKKTDDHMVRILIDAGATADPHANDPWGSPLLGQSLRSAGKAIILRVLASDVYTSRWHEDFNWIMSEVNANNYSEVEQVLVSRLEAIVEEVSRPDPDQVPPLEPYHTLTFLAACIYGLPDMIAPLAKHGVDLNATFVRDTGLSIATERRHTKVVQSLLELGADPNIPNGLGSYPIHEAASEGHDQILRTLLQSGANPSPADGAQRRPLHKATMYGKETAARLLIEHGADINAPDLSRKRPLDMAVSFGRESFVRLLIDHGADVHAVNAKGDAVLVSASGMGNLEILDVILQASDSVPIEQLNRAASEALTYGHDEIVERLVAKGAEAPVLPSRRESTDESSSSSADEENDHSTPKTQVADEDDLETCAEVATHKDRE